MTPDEAAKAEAESIATRWVPAHMTARQGMVDDIAKALVTERRLVEEAQADAMTAINEGLKRGMEIDRLKGELAESEKRADALEGLVDTERQSRKETENTLFFVRKDLQKTKGELTEARWLVVERGDKLTLAIDFIQQVADGGVGPTEARAFLADFAAPPAEQATPEGALRNVMAGRLPWVPAEQAHSTYEDGEGRPAPLNAERLISAKPIKAAKAQGEGAPKCQRVTCDGGIECRCAAVRERQLVEDESRLEDSLINRIAEAKSYTLAQVVALAKRVDVIEEWARRQIAEPWFDPERKPASGRGGAAGPGHAYECESGYAGGDCAIGSHKCKCGVRHSDHAIPPIPEGK